MLARIQAEAARLARELKHNAVTELHILLAWLLSVDDLKHPNKDVVRANLRERLKHAIADGKVGEAKGPSLSISPGARVFLREISNNSSDLLKFKELLEQCGISDSSVVVESGASSTVAGQQSDLDIALATLNSMIGLAEVKKKMNDLVAIEKVRAIQGAKGIKTVRSGLNLVFTGDPGTGKTTVARLVGDIYRALGLLSSGHLVEASQSDLIAKFTGQTTNKTQKVINSALGGVLFIDEAYALSQSGTGGFGAEAINTLVKAMDDHRDDLAVIVAGYTEEMIPFIKSNPGLKSRFTNQFYFENYTTAELFQIFKKSSDDLQITFSEEVGVRVKRHLDLNPTSGSGGNGRYVRNLFAALYDNMAIRAMADGIIEDGEMSEFLSEDVPYSLNDHQPPTTVAAALEELDSLIGLQSVKDKMREIIAVQGARVALEKANRPAPMPALNLVFSGPPGTGKTTVARIVSRIYQALGALPRGHIVEVGREHLIGQYLGQTGPKVAARVDEAIGGVLFIDEAYSLTSDSGPSHASFGEEALAALITHIENKRGTFATVLAGYRDEMNRFLEVNPGLKSRMDYTIEFPDYSTDELLQIFLKLAEKNQVAVTDDVRIALKKHLASNETGGVQGNGRYVRKLYDATYTNMAMRAAAVDFDLDVLGAFIEEDVPKYLVKKTTQNPIGFQA
jgi:SpoVK/Ycf46/Vps4 family AAA+-type ATPase